MDALVDLTAAEHHPSEDAGEGRSRLPLSIALPGVVLAVLLAMAVAPQLFASRPPDAIDTSALLAPPSGEHWFGTDQLGRDIFSRVVHGASYSLPIGLGATALGLGIGLVAGLAAALGPRGVDRIVVRALDILLAFPELLLALLVIAVMGPGPLNTTVAVGLAAAAGYARLIRSQVLRVRLSGYVEAAVALGEQPRRIIVGHIVPNVLRPVLVLATVGVGTSLLAASSLSFLGLGVAPPIPEWGAMLADGRNFLSAAPWMSLFPAAMIVVAVVAVTVLGRSLQRVSARGWGE